MRKLGFRSRLGYAAALALLSAHMASADNNEPSIAELKQMTLEEVMTLEVTTVSRMPEALQDTPAAIAVITQEDIRRSGMNRIPELMPLAPGVNVGRIDARTWAISVRGFNDQYANKLLVLQDGRSLYTPAFAGVLWASVDYALEDIDRIEIIRGPGASIWGANAVNGVINIVTKSAKETQGGLFSTAYGTEYQPLTTLRYGGKLAPNVYYRAYAKYFNTDNFETSTGADSADDSRAIRSGLRLDWEPNDDNLLTFEGDYYRGDFGENLGATQPTPPFKTSTAIDDHNYGYHALGKWVRTFSDTSKLSAQTYYDHYRYENLGTKEVRSTFDFDFQHQFALGERQAIIWGAGYRYSQNRIPPTFFVSFKHTKHFEHLYSAFLQDEIALVQDTLKLTLGSKFEHNSFTGFEVQPTGRLTWTPTENQTVWGGVSRAVRTPSEFEREGRINTETFPGPAGLPGFIAIVGDNRVKSEELIAYELGYRIQATPSVAFDLASFYYFYDNLINFSRNPLFLETTPPPPHVVVPLVEGNPLSGRSYGVELLAYWQPTARWKLTAGYTLLQMLFDGDAREGDVPQNQFQIRSYLDLTHHFELNAAAYYVDSLSTDEIPSYIRADVGLVWKPTDSLEIGVWGQNLLDDEHFEFGSTTAPVQTEIPRTFYGKITWRF